ncbi:MAG: hypothetical protein J5629_06590 [Muribaculaceae bacterium]|nr:hypothetical protein [Muribaculaceae bacterium]
MTQEQLEMNSQLFGLLQKICSNEALMVKGIKALQGVLNSKDKDDTLMTEEEFNEKLNRGIKAYESGECSTMLANEDLTAYLKRRGYEL